MNRRNIFVLFLILVASAVLTRVLPYIFNFEAMFFQPILAMGIFSITTFRKEKTAILVPLAALLVSDLVIELVKPGFGFYTGQSLNYLFLALAISISYFFKGTKSAHVTWAVILVPFAYYLLSNGVMVFAAHGDAPLYSKDFSGLIKSYTAAFPFFVKDLTSTAIFASLFFGVYRYLVAKQYIKAWA
jgi:hypothetical protein